MRNRVNVGVSNTFNPSNFTASLEPLNDSSLLARIKTLENQSSQISSLISRVETLENQTQTEQS